MFLNVSKLQSLLNLSAACIQLFLSFSWLHLPPVYRIPAVNLHFTCWGAYSTDTMVHVWRVYSSSFSVLTCVCSADSIDFQQDSCAIHSFVTQTLLCCPCPSPQGHATSAGAPNELMTPRRQCALFFKWPHWKYFVKTWRVHMLN